MVRMIVVGFSDVNSSDAVKVTVTTEGSIDVVDEVVGVGGGQDISVIVSRSPVTVTTEGPVDCDVGVSSSPSLLSLLRMVRTTATPVAMAATTKKATRPSVA